MSASHVISVSNRGGVQAGGPIDAPAAKPCSIIVFDVPSWVPVRRLLGPFDWRPTGETGCVETELSFPDAADVRARLRGVILDGRRMRVCCRPEIRRSLLRKALLQEARRMREKTEVFRRSGVRIDKTGRLSVTPEAVAMRLAKAASGKSVVDAFCGLGGNAIAFAREGCRVEAFEIDARRLKLAVHNARIYDVKLQLHHRDFLEALPKLRADLLWMDPPWEPFTRSPCHLGNFEILKKTLERIRPGRFQEVWIKLPPSFDTKSLPEFRCEAVFGEGRGDRQRVKFVWARSECRGQ